MQFSFLHILIVVVLVVVLFGRGKISDLMGDVATGIKNFKKGINDDDNSTGHVTRIVDTKTLSPKKRTTKTAATTSAKRKKASKVS